MQTLQAEAVPGFDWEAYENDLPTSLVLNEKVSREGMRVYSHAKYAGELADIYERSMEGFAEPSTGQAVEGRITQVGRGVAHVDIGWREDAVVDLEREGECAGVFVPGNRVDVWVHVRRKKPPVASHRRFLTESVKAELIEAIGDPVAYHGKVVGMVENAGFIVDVGGVECFMPGSLGGMNKLVDFGSLVGEDLYVVPINYSPERDCVVVSHREYLKTLVPERREGLKEGDRHEGFVTGSSQRYGVFVEFLGCLTGLVSPSDMDADTKERFRAGDFRPGDDIAFYIKEIVDDRIVLSTVQVEPSPWENIDEHVQENDFLTGTIRKIVRFGMFVEIKPRLVGLVHKSYIDDSDTYRVGQEVDVLVKHVDPVAKKIDLAV